MNKKHFKIAFLIVAFALFSACQNRHVNHVETSAENKEKEIYQAVGVIKKIDADAPKLTISHEDIRGYMSAMTMDFDVRDKSLIVNVKPGDKVEFELERTGEKLIVTKITKTSETANLNGGEIYKTNCAECHGASGEGTKKGISFLKGHALHHSESEFVKQVANGDGKKMPAFRDKLSDEQIAAVIRFVRNEIQAKAEKHSHH